MADAALKEPRFVQVVCVCARSHASSLVSAPVRVCKRAMRSIEFNVNELGGLVQVATFESLR